MSWKLRDRIPGIFDSVVAAVIVGVAVAIGTRLLGLIPAIGNWFRDESEWLPFYGFVALVGFSVAREVQLQRWRRKHMPEPAPATDVPTYSRAEILDELSQGPIITALAPHPGYWDRKRKRATLTVQIFTSSPNPTVIKSTQADSDGDYRPIALKVRFQDGNLKQSEFVLSYKKGTIQTEARNPATVSFVAEKVEELSRFGANEEESVGSGEVLQVECETVTQAPLKFNACFRIS